MEITETRITLSHDTHRLKAFVNIVIDDCFVIRGLKVIESDRGCFVAMPSVKKGEGRQDIAHPINNETRLMVEKIVLDAYEMELSRNSKEEPDDIAQPDEEPEDKGEIEYGR